MESVQLSLILTYMIEILFVICPLLFTFPNERRYSRAATAGVFSIFLALVLALILSGSRIFLDNVYWRSFCVAVTIITGVWACRYVTGLDMRIVIYTVFLYRNFADTARICTSLINSLRHYSESAYPVRWPELSIYFFVLLVMVGFAYCLLHRYLVRAVALTRPLFVWNYFPAVPIAFFLLYRLLGYATYMNMDRYSINYSLLPACGWVICIFTVHVVMLKTLADLEEGHLLRERCHTAELLVNAQRAQTARLQKSLERYRSIRHDTRHHMAAVKGLLDQGQCSEASAYIADFLNRPGVLSGAEHCSSAAVSALLNYYLDLAKSAGIETLAEIRMPDPLPLPEIDFCTILGNLLENALESCLRQTEGDRYIQVRACMSGTSMMALTVCNTYSHQIRQKDGLFYSSKRDDMGVGTASIRHLAERYHGILKFNYQDGRFEASLLLNPSMKK